MSGKKYAELAKKVDRSRLYPPYEALDLAKATNPARFDATVEVAFRLGVDPRRADQMVRGTVTLPNGTGKTLRVAVFAEGEAARQAEEAGADVVGGADLAERIQGGFLEFDAAVASPDMMGTVGRLGRVLGPRGLMPNPRTGTVTPDVGRVVRESKGGRVEFRTDRSGVLHAPIGKLSFDPDKLAENLGAFIDAINRAKPTGAKGQYLRSITVTSTMGPGFKLDLNQAQALAAV